MAARYKFDVVAHVNDRADPDNPGKKKPVWMRCGVIFERDDGGLSMKLDAVPVGSFWSGWFNFYPPRDKPPSSGNTPRNQQNTEKAASPAGEDDFDDDIPF